MATLTQDPPATRQETARRYGISTATNAGLTGARRDREARLIAAEYLGGPAYDWDRLRRVKAHEFTVSQRLARRHSYPIKSFTLNRKSGAIVRVHHRTPHLAKIARSRSPLVLRSTNASTRSHARPREHRKSRTAATRGSPARPDDEKLAQRRCAAPGCNEVFTSADPRRNYCHSRPCNKARNAAKQREHKAKARAAAPINRIPTDVRDAAVHQVRNGNATGVDALAALLRGPKRNQYSDWYRDAWPYVPPAGAKLGDDARRALVAIETAMRAAA